MTLMNRIKSKWPWLVMYGLFFAAGVFALLYPSQVVLTASKGIIAYVWALFLVFGGGICCFGILKGSWVGEIVGIPFLCGSHAVFSIALFAYSTSNASIAISLIFVGIVLGLVGRWSDVRWMLNRATEVTDDSP